MATPNDFVVPLWVWLSSWSKKLFTNLTNSLLNSILINGFALVSRFHTATSWTFRYLQNYQWLCIVCWTFLNGFCTFCHSNFVKFIIFSDILWGQQFSVHAYNSRVKSTLVHKLFSEKGKRIERSSIIRPHR